MANPGPSVADHLCRGDELRPLGKGPGLDSGAGVGGRGIPVLANRPRRRGMMEEISGGMRQHNIMFPAPPSRPTFFFERRRRHAVCGHRPS